MMRQQTWLKRLLLKSLLCTASIMVFGLLVGPLVGCRSTPALFVYTSLDEKVANRLFNRYQSATGTKVAFVRLSTGEAAARIEAEKNNPQASLWVGGVGLGHVQLKQKGLTLPYAPKGVDKIDVHFKDPQHFWTGLYMGLICLVGNKDQLEKNKLTIPASWQGLLDPRLKGHIQMANPGTSGTAYNVITTLIKIYGEKEAMQYLKRLHGNISQYTRSGAAPAKNAVLGETILALGYVHDVVRLIEENKAPLVYAFPTEGTGYEIASVSLIKGAKQEAMAKQLYDWLLTQEAAQIFADEYYVPFIRDGVTLRQASVKSDATTLIHTDIEWDGSNKERLVELWNEQING